MEKQIAVDMLKTLNKKIETNSNLIEDCEDLLWDYKRKWRSLYSFFVVDTFEYRNDIDLFQNTKIALTKITLDFSLSIEEECYITNYVLHKDIDNHYNNLRMNLKKMVDSLDKVKKDRIEAQRKLDEKKESTCESGGLENNKISFLSQYIENVSEAMKRIFINALWIMIPLVIFYLILMIFSLK